MRKRVWCQDDQVSQSTYVLLIKCLSNGSNISKIPLLHMVGCVLSISMENKHSNGGTHVRNHVWIAECIFEQSQEGNGPIVL